jgi:hypothetical protein
MSPHLTLVHTTLSLVLGCAVCEAHAQPQIPTPPSARSSSATAEPPTADFLQPLSRKLEAQLPDLGTSPRKREQTESRNPGFNTLWVWPKSSPPQEGTHQSGG